MEPFGAARSHSRIADSKSNNKKNPELLLPAGARAASAPGAWPAPVSLRRLRTAYITASTSARAPSASSALLVSSRPLSVGVYNKLSGGALLAPHCLYLLASCPTPPKGV
eukprot:scaffold15168_cov126-Isochrysis_galbana.AAC.5